METKQLAGIIGAVALALGVFTPIGSLPLLGNYSLIGTYDISAILILLLAVSALVLTLLNKCRLLWGSGIVATVILIVTLLSILSRLKQEEGALQWGWLLLFAGAIAIIITAVLEELSLRK